MMHLMTYSQLLMSTGVVQPLTPTSGTYCPVMTSVLQFKLQRRFGHTNNNKDVFAELLSCRRRPGSIDWAEFRALEGCEDGPTSEFSGPQAHRSHPACYRRRPGNIDWAG